MAQPPPQSVQARRPLPQIFLGVLLVTAGVLALLGQAGVVDVSLGQLLGTWWPLVVIAVGLAALLTVPRAWAGPSAVVGLGVLLQLITLDLIELDFWEVLWPVVIILVGLSLLTRVGSRGTDDQTVNAAVMWWGTQRRSASQDFQGGSLSAVMGGIDLDLRHAGIGSRAELSIFTLWGGVEVKVPPTWRVVIGGLPVLAGWEDKTAPPDDPDAPVLTIHVTAIMGGLEVRN
ncbi:LiaI-LiaF-like domain-containing protein [Actinotalea sp. C106]|uniref:LiaF transmembrane domain-containing protein n=1 Tax=Actinotalea sp. C106 TaxID=2908644 RepID=UPI0020294737|nr:DUF5668 domain-containing protein [Actinotalea sp. C106]